MEKYRVIELAEGYDYLYGMKDFDNLKDAKNFLDEAKEIKGINYAEIIEYKLIDNFMK